MIAISYELKPNINSYQIIGAKHSIDPKSIFIIKSINLS